ncbi:MAG: VanZ family protein [Thermoanaerobaculia bacterium]
MAPSTNSQRERRLWIWAGGLLLAIYASFYSVRPLADWLRERGLLRGTIIGLFLLAAGLVLRWCLARSPGWREIAVLAGFTLLYLAVLWPIRFPEERFHLLEYGLFAGLVYLALLERRRPGAELRWSAPAALVAALATGLAGWLDEGIQHLLPNRQYDWLDVGLNLLAAVLAIGALAALAEAHRADRGAAG